MAPFTPLPCGPELLSESTPDRHGNIRFERTKKQLGDMAEQYLLAFEERDAQSWFFLAWPYHASFLKYWTLLLALNRSKQLDFQRSANRTAACRLHSEYQGF